MQEGAWLLYIFFHIHNFIREVQVLILDNKQLVSNMIDREATQIPYTTRIVFLTDSYVVLSNIIYSIYSDQESRIPQM